MKIKIKNEKRIKEFLKKQRGLCKEYNIYPIMEIDVRIKRGKVCLL